MANRKDVQLLQASIERTVRLLTQRDIPVHQTGSMAFVRYNKDTLEPEMVNIPVITDNASDRFIAAIHGFIDHEVAHVLYSDASVLAEGVENSIRYHNGVEDCMIESVTVKEFPGARVNLRKTREMIIEEIMPGVAEKAAKSDDLLERWNLLSVAAFRAWAGQDQFADFMSDKWHLIQDVVDKLGDIIPSLAKLTDSQMALDVAREIQYRLYGDPNKPDPSQQPDPKNNQGDPGSESSNGENDDEDGDDDNGTGSGDASDEGEQDDDEGDDDASDSGRDSDDDADDDESDEQEGKESDDSVEEDDKSDADDGDSSDEGGDDQDQADGESDDGESDDGESDDGESDGDAEDDNEGDDDDGSSQGDSDEEADDESGDSSGSDEDDVGESESEDERSEGSGDTDDSKANGSSLPDGGDGDGQINETAEELPIFKDMELPEAEEDDQLAKLLENIAGEEQASAKYVPYTRKYDKIEPPDYTKTSCLEREVNQMQDEVDEVTSGIRRHLERMFVAMNRSRYEAGKRTGRLSNPDLYRLRTGDDRVFKTKEISKTKETAVTLLCDCSGSMCGDKINAAMMSAWAMAECLTHIGIPFEILGFTTSKGVTTDEAHELNEARNMHGQQYTRYESLYIPIFKSFGDKFGTDAKYRMTAMTQGSLCMNIDGESLRVAGDRILRQRQENKVIIVLSDGCPNASTVSDVNLERHLLDTIADLEKSGVKTVGIGINSTAVKQFYKKHVVIRSVKDLPGTVIKNLGDMVLAR